MDGETVSEDARWRWKLRIPLNLRRRIIFRVCIYLLINYVCTFFDAWRWFELWECNQQKANKKKWNKFALLFAIIFTALQYYEYLEAGFTIADSVYGTVFFASTGLHGFHVIVGTIFIGVQFIRILNHHITTTHHVGLESSIAYWHFVDVVWLFLYAFVYLWSAPNL